MRIVLIIVAALVILGLAAFGVVSAQKMAAVQTAPATPTTRAAAAPPHAPVSQPVSQIAQAVAPSASEFGRPADPPGTDHAAFGCRRAERARHQFIRARQHASWQRAGSQYAGQAHADRHQYSAVRQTRRHGDRAHRRDRHHRRSGLRLRALQAVRLPPRQRDHPDVRRWPVAGKHSRRPQGAGRRMPEGDILRNRRARDLASGNHQTGDRRRHDGRHPHLVAQGSGAQSLRQGSRQGRAGNRDGQQRRAYGGRRRADRAVLPLSRPATPAAAPRLSCSAQHRHLLDRYRLAGLQAAQARSSD